ncbi:MAG: hypothetical protein AB8B91_07275 [Rubripirellula sp.]
MDQRSVLVALERLALACSLEQPMGRMLVELHIHKQVLRNRMLAQQHIRKVQVLRNRKLGLLHIRCHSHCRIRRSFCHSSGYRTACSAIHRRSYVPSHIRCRKMVLRSHMLEQQHIRKALQLLRNRKLVQVHIHSRCRIRCRNPSCSFCRNRKVSTTIRHSSCLSHIRCRMMELRSHMQALLHIRKVQVLRIRMQAPLHIRKVQVLRSHMQALLHIRKVQVLRNRKRVHHRQVLRSHRLAQLHNRKMQFRIRKLVRTKACHTQNRNSCCLRHSL